MPTSRQRGHSVAQVGSTQHFVSYNSIKACFQTYFGCHKLGRTTESASSLSIPHILLAETIICDFDVSVEREKDVIELQITVHDALFMEVFESEKYFCSIEARSSGCELFSLNMQHEIPARNVFHAAETDKISSVILIEQPDSHKVDTCLSLEAGVQVQQEWMSFSGSRQEDSFLALCAFNFIIFNDEFLFQYLDSP